MYAGSLPERSIVYMDGLVWQVVLSEPGRAILIPKYRIGGGGPLYSRVSRTRLERLVYHYRPREIAKVRSERLDPCLDGRPVELSGRSLVCDPLCRREELLRWPRDRLERVASSLLGALEELGVRAYPTGSLLGYYHNEGVSDVDLVVYVDETPCDEAIDALSSLLEPLPEHLVYRWARARNATPLYYRRWAYGVYRGVRVSVVFAYRSRGCCETVAWPLGARVAVQGRVESLGCRTLVWPHIAVVGDTPLVSFDGLYAPLLYEEPVVRAEGVAGIVKHQLLEGEGVVVGLAEASYRLSPLL